MRGIETRRTSADLMAASLTFGLGAMAWLALVTWTASPWGSYLRHDTLAGGPAATAVGVFAGGWLVMLTAMMLPTTYPLVRLFDRMVAARADRSAVVSTVLGGYAAVWMIAGLLAYAGDEVVHAIVDRVPAIEDRPWAIASAVFAGAGMFQLSSLKTRCLTRCRSPRVILMTRWRGRAPVAEAFTIGAAHGRECLSCCWALMLVMFAVGAGNFAWMLALATAMTVEKMAPRGRMVTKPLGAGLLVAAIGLVIANV